MSAPTSTPTPVEHTGPISAPMVAALEAAWAAIRANHPEVPRVVVILGAGSGSGPGLKLGHFAAMRWGTEMPALGETATSTAAGMVAERLPEVFVGGEGLIRGPADVLATLLHEAAHALAHVRGVKDTSRQGRWHNARFKALAEEVGIAVAKDARIGWSPTTLPEVTREGYAEVIADLGGVLRWFRAVEGAVLVGGAGGSGGNDGDGQAGGGETPKKPGSIACDCGRTIRVARAVLEQAPITCGLCGSGFRVRDERDGDDGGPTRPANLIKVSMTSSRQRNAVSQGIALGLLLRGRTSIPVDKFAVDLAFEGAVGEWSYIGSFPQVRTDIKNGLDGSIALTRADQSTKVFGVHWLSGTHPPEITTRGADWNVSDPSDVDFALSMISGDVPLDGWLELTDLFLARLDRHL